MNQVLTHNCKYRQYFCPKSHLLVIKAAYKTKAKKGKIYWQVFGEKDFQETNSIEFNINSDGKFETYSIPIGNQANYKGIITRLKIVPNGDEQEGGGWIKIKSIAIN